MTSARVTPAETRGVVAALRGAPAAFRRWFEDYFLSEPPSLLVACVPYWFVAMALYTRNPTRTNFIFDEQEALLANPYVRSVAEDPSKLRWVDAFYRDFWGLTPDRSIGSYRPMPNLVWRALWALGARDQTPFFHHLVNVLLHGVNGALLCVLVMQVTKDRRTAWLAGLFFTASAVCTEAVSGVVGIADVLSAMGALASLLALATPMPVAFVLVFVATLFGLYSKESALACVPLVPAFAMLTARATHPDRPRAWARGLVALVATSLAFVLYVEARRRMFPAAIAPELTAEATANKGTLGRAFAAVLRWYAQPNLPKDPLNNPLVSADMPHRIAGALRVYARGIGQVLFPWTLSGDYSAPQEPIPPQLVFPGSVVGAIAMVGPLVLAPIAGVAAWLRGRRMPAAERPDLRPVVAAALLWMAVSYFPVSNIPVLLPTVRAERFWYFPVIGTSIVLGVAFTKVLDRFRAPRARTLVLGGLSLFLAVQFVKARLHANDYADDLTFWDATRKAVPRSAKAHLNYSVMKSARGDFETRLASSRTALDLAPEWPMASVYLGDALCRMHRAPEAWPHYKRGFELGVNDVSLIALGLQCLWEEKQIQGDEGAELRAELAALREKYPGSWLAYLAGDILDNGATHDGVDPKYRPRGYNQGPKD